MKRKLCMLRDVTDDLSNLDDVVAETVSADSVRDQLADKICKMQTESSEIRGSDDNLIFCEYCRKWFRSTAKDGEEVRCPYCGMKLESASELHVTDPSLSNEDKARLLDMARVQNTDKSKWEDTRKEQISLEMGSVEYLERVEDLKLHDPFRPDDEMHAELEERNEDLVMKRMEDLAENPFAEKEKRLYEIEMRRNLEREKRSLHAKAVRTAIASAAITETLADDQLARAITTDNELLYDPTVKPKDYVEKLDEFVQEMSK